MRAGSGSTGGVDGLRGRALRAGGWAFGLRIVERTLGLVRTVVLARLLAPEDFGRFGIALLALSALETLSQTGISAALVHRRGELSEYLDTAWTLGLLRSAAIAALLLAGGPTVADFFGEPGAGVYVQALAAAVLLQGAANVGVVRFQRDLEFGRRFWYLLSGTATDLAVSLLVAFLTGSAWALVAGLVAGSAARMVASYVLHPYRPRPSLDSQRAKELLVFGRWVFASGILIYLITQGDDILVGRLLGVTALGLYQMAYLLANLPATQITHVVSEVAFPVYASIHADPDALRAAFLRTLRAAFGATLPLAVIIVGLAPEGVAVVLGDDWAPAVAPLRILALLGVLRAIGAAQGALYQGAGAPREDTVIAAIHLAALAALVLPLIERWGIAGAAAASVAAMVPAQLYGVSRVTRLLRCSAGAYAGALVPALPPAAAAAAVVAAAKYALPSPTAILFVGGPAAGVAAALLLLPVLRELGTAQSAPGTAAREGAT